MSSSDDHELDLMAAAAIGVVAGIALTFLMTSSRKRGGRLVTARRELHRAGKAGLKNVRSAGRAALKGARHGIEHGIERGRDFIDEIPMDDIGEELRDYLDAAKSAIEDTVKDELRDLQKSLRRRRKRMGI